MRGNPVAGTPILPANYLIGIILGFLVFLGIIYLIVHFTSHHVHPKSEIRRFILWSVVSIIAILAYIFYLLMPPPMVTATSPSENLKDVSLTGPVTIQFNEPVSRAIMDKSITPDVPGVWIFEDPVYSTHLYRKVSFYPDAGFNSDTTYTVKISNIKNALQTSKSDDLVLSFTTKAAPRTATQTLTTIQSETVKLPVPSYLQQHTLSCEVASLRMALAYRGVTKSEDELLAQVGVDNTPHIDGTWGNPYERFVGNVNGNQMRDGYGVYWGPIERVAKMYGNAQAFQNGNIGVLTSNILKGNPTIIWVYSESGAPTHWKTPSGVDVFAVAGEHTVVVVGFVGTPDNPSQIIVNDSLVGQVYWPRAFFDRKWATFSQSGVTIY